jgi:hypothetical protein
MSETQTEIVKSTRNEPSLPVKYHEACRALAECTTIDEAKQWHDKAEALAAWAKIYKNDQAGVEARRLKLHAYRRMGILAEQIQPGKRVTVSNDNGSGLRGQTPGPVSLLKDHGFTKSQARDIRVSATIGQAEFDSLTSLPRPPSPSLLRMKTANGTDAWRLISMLGYGLGAFRGFTRKFKAADLAVGLNSKEKEDTARMCVEVMEWLDEMHSRCTQVKGRISP